MFRWSIPSKIQKRFYCTNLLALPFKIEREKANKLLSINTTSNFDINDPIKEYFIPFYSANITGIITEYSARYAVNKTYTYKALTELRNTYQMVPQTGVITIWHESTNEIPAMSYPLGTKWSQIYADFVYPRSIMESVLPTNLKCMEPITPYMVGRRVIYPHQMEESYALEKIINRLYDVEKKRVEKYLADKYEARDIKIERINIKLRQASITMHSYFIPAYIRYPFGTTVPEYNIVNAYTGETRSDIVLSSTAAFKIGGTIGAISFALFYYAISVPHIQYIYLVANMLIGFSIAGLLSFIYTTRLNNSQQREYIDQMDRESKKNFRYISTSNGTKRIKLDKEMLKNVRIPMYKLELLGLKTNVDITLINLKKNLQ